MDAKQKLNALIEDAINDIANVIVKKYTDNIQKEVNQVYEQKQNQIKEKLEQLKASDVNIKVSLDKLIAIVKNDIQKNAKLKTEELQKEKGQQTIFNAIEIKKASDENKQIIKNGGNVESIEDINIKLTWYCKDDLDLHCTCPCGTHIFHQKRQCPTCKAKLDLDMNYAGVFSDTPNEHIHLANKNNDFKLMPGKYEYWVEVLTGNKQEFEVSVQTNGKYYFTEGESQQLQTYIKTKKFNQGDHTERLSFQISPEKTIDIPNKCLPDKDVNFMKQITAQGINMANSNSSIDIFDANDDQYDANK